MVSDLYSEILVKRQSGSTDMLKKGGLIALILLLAAGGIVFTPILLLAAVVLGAVAWFFIFPLFHVEYEYLIVNKELDIDAIYAQQKRKTVAKYDLETRGPGDFFGEAQHGLPTLQIADLVQDTRTLTVAQAEAKALLAVDPSLSRPEHKVLSDEVERLFSTTGAMN